MEQETLPKEEEHKISRRKFLRYTAAMGLMAGMSSLLPAYAFSGFKNREVLSPKGNDNVIDLTISNEPVTIDGKKATATAINGTVPGPLVRLKEGEDVLLRVTNKLDESTSIHWHGLILPFQMDGVPGVSYDGIKPGETFEYRFTVQQNGTYWYHSHTGLQEQTGVYGPIIIDPADQDPVEYDREYPVVLSDWTFEDPYKVLAHLKKNGGYYNYQKRTLGEFFKDVSDEGFFSALGDRLSWGRMRMSPVDLADITGATYTYLMNGRAPGSNWHALFKKGEKVRLRFINASSGSFYDVRIPGLKMTVVQADGQNVEPVPVDEFRIAIAETYDVIVEPEDDQAYTIFAESLDRSGYARGTLAPRKDMVAPVPERRPRPKRTMRDMGMKMDGMKMNGDMTKMKQANGQKSMDMKQHDMQMSDMRADPVKHGPDHHGAGAASIAQWEFDRLDEPGVGLNNSDRKVLVYRDLKSLKPNVDTRKPGREIELHLTGNMERYMWSFNGKQFHEVKGPIEFKKGERLKLTLVNDTMMEHPIHLHGMFMEMDNGKGRFRPRKHTLNVQPAQRISAIITADAPGRWAFHCHILYHMEMGMFRVVEVKDQITEA